MKDLLKAGAKQGIFMLLKNPYVLGGVAICVIFFAFCSMFMFMNTGSHMSDESLKTVYVNCKEGKVDMDKFESVIEKAGVFKDMTDAFIEDGNKYQVDPVLLASIALHETGNGTSPAVMNYNNPGGLMDPSTGHLWVFDTLDQGLDKMAQNLYKNYISQGLVTIAQIGNKYAPVGAENDPNNLNINWVPDIQTMANQLGGLSMNCSAVGEGSGEYILPVGNVPITSPYGYRIDPITGASSEFHKGIDFGASLGTPIMAAQGGKVLVANKSGWGGGYGLHVVIDTGDKLNLYGHMSEVLVDVGQHVSQGQVIGKVGQTGSATGPHLHFEVDLSLYGQTIDPMPFFEGDKK